MYSRRVFVIRRRYRDVMLSDDSMSDEEKHDNDDDKAKRKHDDEERDDCLAVLMSDSTTLAIDATRHFGVAEDMPVSDPHLPESLTLNPPTLKLILDSNGYCVIHLT